MRRSFARGRWGAIAAALVLAGSSFAGTRITVSLAGRDDTLPKLGLPGIEVHVHAFSPDGGAAVRGELARDLAHQVHTRRLDAGESGDYDLEVNVEPQRIDGGTASIPFEAVLVSANREPLWRITGRAEVGGQPVDAAVFAGIGRNVISALIHDGWVIQRYDPDDPPPPAPTLRIGG